MGNEGDVVMMMMEVETMFRTVTHNPMMNLTEPPNFQTNDQPRANLNCSRGM